MKPDASRDELQAAYRRLVREHHPDRFATASEAVQAEAHDAPPAATLTS